MCNNFLVLMLASIFISFSIPLFPDVSEQLNVLKEKLTQLKVKLNLLQNSLQELKKKLSQEKSKYPPGIKISSNLLDELKIGAVLKKAPPLKKYESEETSKTGSLLESIRKGIKLKRTEIIKVEKTKEKIQPHIQELTKKSQEKEAEMVILADQLENLAGHPEKFQDFIQLVRSKLTQKPFTHSMVLILSGLKLIDLEKIGRNALSHPIDNQIRKILDLVHAAYEEKIRQDISANKLDEANECLEVMNSFEAEYLHQLNLLSPLHKLNKRISNASITPDEIIEAISKNILLLNDDLQKKVLMIFDENYELQLYTKTLSTILADKNPDLDFLRTQIKESQEKDNEWEDDDQENDEANQIPTWYLDLEIPKDLYQAIQMDFVREKLKQDFQTLLKVLIGFDQAIGVILFNGINDEDNQPFNFDSSAFIIKSKRESLAQEIDAARARAATLSSSFGYNLSKPVVPVAGDLSLLASEILVTNPQNKKFITVLNNLSKMDDVALMQGLFQEQENFIKEKTFDTIRALIATLDIGTCEAILNKMKMLNPNIQKELDLQNPSSKFYNVLHKTIQEKKKAPITINSGLAAQKVLIKLFEERKSDYSKPLTSDEIDAISAQYQGIRICPPEIKTGLKLLVEKNRADFEATENGKKVIKALELE